MGTVSRRVDGQAETEGVRRGRIWAHPFGGQVWGGLQGLNPCSLLPEHGRALLPWGGDHSSGSPKMGHQKGLPARFLPYRAALAASAELGWGGVMGAERAGGPGRAGLAVRAVQRQGGRGPPDSLGERPWK